MNTSATKRSQRPHLPIFKYSLKIWSMSTALCFPIGAILFQLNSMYQEPNLLSINVILEIIEGILVFIPWIALPSSLIFTFCNIQLNKIVAKEVVFKLIVSSLCVILFFLFANHYSIQNLDLFGLPQFTILVYIGLHIIGIWIFKFNPKEKKKENVEHPDILDA